MSSEKSTRRDALGKMLFIITGASVALLGGSGLLVFLSQSSGQPRSASNNNNDSVPSTQQQPALQAQQLFTEIKVYYVGMTNVTGTTMENFEIVSPASLSDLVSEVCQEYPAFETMTTMQILLNGAAPQGNPTLQAGDNVAFLATMVGG